MADQESIQARLDNIRSVEPILGAMRTIALGSWQAALNRQTRIRRYSSRLAELLPPLVARLASAKAARAQGSAAFAAGVVYGSRCLVIGSERGLCGAFNSSLIQYVEQALAQYALDGVEVRVAALGSRVRRGLERNGHDLQWSQVSARDDAAF